MKKEMKIEVIKNIKRLPTLPTIFEQVLETIEDPRSTARILQETIQNDQSITAKVLSMANSAYYGYTKQVSDLSRAIVILGYDMVKNIALSVSIFGLFPRKNDFFDIEQFWLHSIASAYLGRLIANETDYYDPEKAFIACLLHDIGKVVLSSHFEEEFAQVANIIKKKEISFREAEQSMFGFDHTDVGLWLGEKWDFPQELLSAIQYHHDPARAPSRFKELCSITYMANIIGQQEKIGQSGAHVLEEISEEILDILKLDEKRLNGIRQKIKDMREQLETMLLVIS